MNNMKVAEKSSLHKIIHSLSKSDKAHFKKYSKIFISTGETKFKIFYKILEKMKVFTKEELNNQLLKHGGKRSFKNIEKELYDELLQHLVVLKSKTTPQSNYFMEHMKMRYLLDHNMHEECSNQFDDLDKAREKANNTYSDHFYYSYRYMAVNYFKSTREYKDVAEINRVENELRKLVAEINLEFLVTTALNNFNNLRIAGRTKTKKDYLKDLETFEVKYLDVLPKNVANFRSQIQSNYFFLHCFYYEQKRDFKKLGHYSKKFFEKFDSEKMERATDKHHTYVLSVAIRSNYLSVVKDRKAYEITEGLKVFLDTNEFIEMKEAHYSMYYNVVMYSMIKLNDLDRLNSFIKKNKSDFDRLTSLNNSPSQLSGDLFWAYGFFKLKRFEEAQPYLNKIFDTHVRVNEIYNAAYISARVLDILIHFELKNYENIKYFVTNLENEMKRKNHLIPFDSAFFRRLRKLSKQLFAKEKIVKTEFLNFLDDSQDEDRLESYLSLIDVKSWLVEL